MSPASLSLEGPYCAGFTRVRAYGRRLSRGGSWDASRRPRSLDRQIVWQRDLLRRAARAALLPRRPGASVARLVLVLGRCPDDEQHEALGSVVHDLAPRRRPDAGELARAKPV